MSSPLKTEAPLEAWLRKHRKSGYGGAVIRRVESDSDLWKRLIGERNHLEAFDVMMGASGRAAVKRQARERWALHLRTVKGRQVRGPYKQAQAAA